MQSLLKAASLGAALSLAAIALPFVSRADTPGGEAGAFACSPVNFFVEPLHGDRNAAVVSLFNPGGPFTGTITAYGKDRSWSGTIGPSKEVTGPGGRLDSLTVRAGAPIEAVRYAPSWASCTFQAAVNGIDGAQQPDAGRPELALSNPQVLEPATCARRYSAPMTKHAVEPDVPRAAAQQGITGLVKVNVMLDERGVPQSARIASSPSALLNASALDAARRSEYAPAVFLCKPIPSAYQFVISYG